MTRLIDKNNCKAPEIAYLRIICTGITILKTEDSDSHLLIWNLSKELRNKKIWCWNHFSWLRNKMTILRDSSCFIKNHLAENHPSEIVFVPHLVERKTPKNNQRNPYSLFFIRILYESSLFKFSLIETFSWWNWNICLYLFFFQ